MIASYADLVRAVENAMARTDIPATVYSLAVQELNTRLRLQLMDGETVLTAAGQRVPLPDDFLQVRVVWLDGDPRYVLDVHDPWSSVASESGAPGRPALYSISGGEILLHPAPDAEYRIGLRYVTRMDESLTGNNARNVLAAHSSLFLYGALKHAAIWAQDTELAALHSASFEADLKHARKADNAARYPAPLRVRRTVA